MRIDNDHMYHGAALIQIAEHPKFTSINSFKLKKAVIERVYTINDRIGIHLKYAREPVGAYEEYVFGFTQENLQQLARINEASNSLFAALVCVKDREICCLAYQHLMNFVERRRSEKGGDEDQYQILVTVPKGKSFRVYINAPGVKKTRLGKSMIIPRSDFPEKIFG
ncbi:MAG TPA: hypothetical protein VMC85_21610 [Desulfomonilaceae bacterium]|nr:hypothetical protein [Desulfomonilaceae bacterium]